MQQLLAPVSGSELSWLQDEMYIIRSMASGIADTGIFLCRRLADKETERNLQTEEQDLRTNHIKPVLCFVENRQKDLASMDKRKLKFFGFHGIRACRMWLERREAELLAMGLRDVGDDWQLPPAS